MKPVRLARIPRTLPRHAHDLARETVLESQRWRILEAMVEVASRHGFAEASVAPVIERAGVSRKTFYEHFADKEACFLEAYEVLSSRLLQDLARVAESIEGARARRRAQLQCFLDVLGRDVRAARVFMVDVMGAGPKALAKRAEVNDRFAELFLDHLGLGPVRARAIVGGINQVVAGYLLEGGKQPASLEAELAAFVEAAAGDPRRPRPGHRKSTK